MSIAHIADADSIGVTMSDLIRREDALKALLKLPCKIDSDNYTWIRLSDAFGTIDEDVPSAEPERKKGKWIVHDYALGRERYECAECRGRCDLEYNFCPYCGADMRGE